MAHKKAAWSAKNLRDSKPKYRWVKIFWWQKVVAGNIIIRQKWNKYEAGKNTYLGRDFSIHAKIDWVVEFSKANKTRFDGRKYLKTIVNVVSANLVEEKPAPKKVIEKKPAAKTTKKTPVKKIVAAKPAQKKEVDKKSTIKKSAVKKTPTKKVTTKKTTEKKPTAKKPTTKKVTAKKTSK
jgi:large subunit ribosomal protein L27